MGYYTRFGLKVIDPGQESREAIAAEELYGMSASVFLDGTGEKYKWYDHEAELRALSKKYPTAVIRLSGEGEEPGDLWAKFFLNGRMQHVAAHIAFDPYDPEKLK